MPDLETFTKECQEKTKINKVEDANVETDEENERKRHKAWANNLRAESMANSIMTGIYYDE